jgi:hypothetical protein
MQNFKDGIKLNLMMVHPEMRSSKDVKDEINRIANLFVKNFDKVLLCENEVKKIIIKFGEKALKKYNTSTDVAKRCPHKAAGIWISPKKVKVITESDDIEKSVLIAGGVDYFLSELLELSGIEVNNENKKTIQKNHLEKAINDDAEVQEIIRAIS